MCVPMCVTVYVCVYKCINLWCWGNCRNCTRTLSHTRSWLHTWASGTESPAHPQSAWIAVYWLAELFVILWVCPICHGEDLKKGETRITQLSSSLSSLWSASKAELWTITTWNSFNCLFDLSWHKHANTTHTALLADTSALSNWQGWTEERGSKRGKASSHL